MPRWAVPAILVAAILAMLTLTTTAQAAANKPYSLVICALGTSETCAPNPTSATDQPAGVPAGQTGVSMSATVLNENKAGSGINVGSMNLTPPAGFTVTTASISAVAPFVCPSTCSATVAGNVVQLRGMAVPPRSAVTVTMSVNTPQSLATCTMAARCTWNPQAKQSNDFSGPPGNADTLESSTSSPSTVLAKLQFPSAGQPGSVRLGQAITNSDYNPPPSAGGTGGPVLVDIADANGIPVTSYKGVVSLTLNTPNNPLTNPNPATLGGTPSRNASGGVASFSDLTVSDPGNGYTLTASANDLPPTTDSAAFNAQQAAALCPAGAPCATEATSKDWPGPDGAVDVIVKSSSGKKSELVESIDFGNWTAATRTLECGGASAHFAYQAFTVDRPLTATVTTIDHELVKSNFNASVNGQEICLAQTSPFMALNLSTNPPSLTPAAPVTLPDGTQGFAGLEPDCGTKSNQVPLNTGPCVTGRSGKLGGPGGGGTLTITDSSPTDRYIN
jgi:hypothetical protein